MNIVNEIAGVSPLRTFRAPSSEYTAGSTNQQSLVNYLRFELGFRVIGNASYGSVLSRRGLNYVVKIFRRDPCYVAFVQEAMNHQDNPHFPRFRGKILTLPKDKDVFGIRMEGLSPIEGEDKFIYACHLYVRGCQSSWLPHCEYSTKELSDEEVWDTIMNRAGKTMFQALDIVKHIQETRGKSCFVDMHHNNLMLRVNVPVIIDPLAPSGS